MVIKIGDIFEVELSDKRRQFFQFVANDTSMLNSSVIRVFKTKYQGADLFDEKRIVEDEVEFNAHVFIRIGVKLALWKKVGKGRVAGTDGILFRNSGDYGTPQIKISKNWYVWKINEPYIDVGELTGKYRDAEIGVVIAPQHIVTRMQIGKYDFVYPGF